MMRNRKRYEEIVSLQGKFEGEQPWVVYYWEEVLNGGQDEFHGTYDVFHLDEHDYKMWPELSGYDEVRIYTDDNGFVYGESYKYDTKDERDA